MPMHELVRSNFQTKVLSRLRRFSFAGDGLPERMRSTAFAFLGLTAAAGLALVAIFAQLSFPLLSPAPLPSGPTEGSAVAKAVALDRGARASERPTSGLARPVTGGSGKGSSTGTGGERGPVPTAAVPAAPTATDPGEGTSGGVPVETPSPNTAPAPSSEPAPAKPDDPAPARKPAPTPARPAAPTPPPAPGNSQSSAASSHASERGVEASSKQGSEATASGVPTSPGASPGNGNGKALGLGK
jgi:hypothetical protein